MKFATKKIIIVLIALFIAFVFALGILVIFDPFRFSGIEVAVSKSTKLEIESGVVNVNNQRVQSGIALVEGDVIEVLDGGIANVLFFDDSVSRINGGSKVKLEVLDSSEYASGQSYILINLENGEMWSKTPRQTSPDITFKVKTISVNATIRGSSLNIKTDEQGKTEVFATEHSSEITAIDSLSGEILQEVVLIEGQKAKIGFENQENNLTEEEILQDEIVNKIIIETMELVEKLTAWFKLNFEKDKLFEIALRKKIEEIRNMKAGALPGTFGYKIKSLKDSLSLFTAGNKKDDLKLKIAERKLIEAKILFAKGDIQKAKKLMFEAGDMIIDVSNKSKENKNVALVIQSSKRLLRETLPNENDYEVNNFLASLEENVATEDKKLIIRRYNFNRKILDIYDYSKGSDKEGAKKQLEKFKNELIDKYNKDANDTDVKDAIENPYFEMTIRGVNNASEDDSRSKILNNFFIQEVIKLEGFKDLLPNIESETEKDKNNSSLDDNENEDNLEEINNENNDTPPPPLPPPPPKIVTPRPIIQDSTTTERRSDPIETTTPNVISTPVSPEASR